MSYINQVTILQCGPPCLHCTLPKKIFLSPSVWARREYIWKLNWKESLLIYFENCQGAPCSHRQSRNTMMNSFVIIVNITSLEDNFMILVHFKKVFPLTLLALIWKKSLLITVSVWKLPGYSLSLHRQSKQKMVNTLIMIKINPTFKRLLSFTCQEKTKIWLISPISK